MTFVNNILQFLSRKQDSLWRFSFIIVIAFFLAKSVNLLIAHYALPLEFAPLASVARSPSETSQPTTDIQLIRSRNIFDSEARSRIARQDDRQLSGTISPSTLPLELVGTVVFKNSRYSVALIKERGTNRMAYYAIGDPIQSAYLRQIDRFRVVLENNGRLESLELKAAESKIASSARLITPSSPGRAGSGDGVAFEELGPGRFAVPQSFIDETMANFSQVLTQARMVPNLTPENRTDGFRVFQIKPGSLFEKMGMKDQDVIKRVNGQDLDSFEKATGLFGALRNEKTISIDIVRNGARINYTYEIR